MCYSIRWCDTLRAILQPNLAKQAKSIQINNVSEMSFGPIYLLQGQSYQFKFEIGFITTSIDML